ncbi:metallo-beta-lactamase superfamily protein [Aspergillus uvarum CBS 121591]|uniref:Metallo-beta-lactamase superfamily protein n=1 Tax=Aspergillus uvarum CBS 121591 TaxID=1448315 RepID=A0A319CC64_9EURO|nr:metallo-beta-lactamase superfamily protein [Aspergillus uvarum CBS 121591]PYH81920.1 metallo-beta-lactamase superfamily protein [Aspergillus uvarum CBS 121591]
MGLTRLSQLNCPSGTRLHILNLGTLQADEGFLIRGANTSLVSETNPVSKRRDLMAIAVLIDHPDAGLLLFETGCAENIETQWGRPMTDVFPRTEYKEEHKLPKAIKKAGYNIKDIKGVIFGHLHIDHAGGLEHFRGTDVPIYVHELEFKHACWAVATGADRGVYLADYLSLSSLNWQTFHESSTDLFQGITLHHAPGHTPGLCIMQVNLERDGTIICTTDQYHVRENHLEKMPQGWLAREHNDWVRSSAMVNRLQRLFNARLLYGHDKEVAEAMIREKEFFQ